MSSVIAWRNDLCCTTEPRKAPIDKVLPLVLVCRIRRITIRVDESQEYCINCLSQSFTILENEWRCCLVCYGRWRNEVKAPKLPQDCDSLP